MTIVVWRLLNYEILFSASGLTVFVPLLSLEQRFIAIVFNLLHIKFRVSESYMKYMLIFYCICTYFSYCGVCLVFYRYLKA